MKKTQKIVGIDPGTSKSGLVILDTETGMPIFAEHIHNKDLVSQVLEILPPGDNNPIISYERMRHYAFSNNSGAGESTFLTCKWYGRFIEAFFNVYSKTKIYSITSPSIKLYLLGQSNAPKGFVKKSIYELYPQDGGGKTPAVGVKNQPGSLFIMKGSGGHAWDALAVALTIEKSLEGVFTGDMLQEVRI